MGCRTMLTMHRMGTYQENELTRNSSGNTRPQSSQPAEPLWTNPDLKRWNLYAQADLRLLKKKKKKTAGGEWIVEPSPKNLAMEGKTN